MKACIIGFFAGACLAAANATAETLPRFVLAWGSEGAEPGEFDTAQGIATDSMGRVYVGDDHRIQVFDAGGAFLTMWGQYGSADGQFMGGVRAVAVDASDLVYVVDGATSRVQKFDASGRFVKKWGYACETPQDGDCEGGFGVITDIALDTSANLYVLELGNYRVQKFDREGNFLLKWGTRGTGPGQFENPLSIAVDSSGKVYVGDRNRLQKFDADGNYILEWGQRGSVHFLGTRNGIVYANDSGGGCRLFTSDGAFLNEWRDDDVPPFPEKDERLVGGVGIAFNASEDSVYLAQGYRVLKFRFAPTLVESTTWTALKQVYRR